MRALIWWFYDDLKAYRAGLTARRRGELFARFEHLPSTHRLRVTLDRLLQRLHANKARVADMVLDRPEIPHCIPMAAERDIRLHCDGRFIMRPLVKSFDRLEGCFAPLTRHGRAFLAIAALTGGRGEVVGSDLIRRAAARLTWSDRNVGRNQLSYQVAADTQRLRYLAQGEPFAAFFC